MVSVAREEDEGAVLCVLVGVTSRVCDRGESPGFILMNLTQDCLSDPGAAFLSLQQPGQLCPLDQMSWSPFLSAVRLPPVIQDPSLLFMMVADSSGAPRAQCAIACSPDGECDGTGRFKKSQVTLRKN